MALAEELEAIARQVAAHASPGEELTGLLAAEPLGGARVYLCSFEGGPARRWLLVDRDAAPVDERSLVRDAASIAALCEIAAETAGGGELEALRAQLVAVRMREAPPGIEEAEEAALEVERVVGGEPRVASPAYLDAVGTATRALELALGQGGPSPFAAAMQEAMGAVEALAAEVVGAYMLPLR